MGPEVFAYVPEEDRVQVEVDAAQILEASLDLQEVPWGDDEYDYEAA